MWKRCGDIMNVLPLGCLGNHFSHTDSELVKRCAFRSFGNRCCHGVQKGLEMNKTIELLLPNYREVKQL